MARKKHAEEHENLERWLVSYADFMTLLFATFVVLYALSQLDLAKFKDLQISLRKAFAAPQILQGDKAILDSAGSSILTSGSDPASSIITPLFENMEAKQEESAFDKTKEAVEETIKEGKQQGVEVNTTDRGLVITVVENLIFGSGSAEIKPSGYPALEKIGKLLKAQYPDHLIRVEGHTDNIPIKGIYPSNWELSSARSSSVIRFIIERLKFQSNRFAAIGYADSKPVSSNSTEEGRRQNRRVEIIVLRNKLIDSEPFTPDLNQTRAEHVKNLQEERQKIVDKYTNVSDAARKLMRDTGKSIDDIILPDDPYERETIKYEKELKEKEAKKRKELKLPDSELHKSVHITKEEEQKIDMAKKKGYINDAVAALMKESGINPNTILIKQYSSNQDKKSSP